MQGPQTGVTQVSTNWRGKVNIATARFGGACPLKEHSGRCNIIWEENLLIVIYSVLNTKLLYNTHKNFSLNICDPKLSLLSLLLNRLYTFLDSGTHGIYYFKMLVQSLMFIAVLVGASGKLSKES